MSALPFKTTTSKPPSANGGTSNRENRVLIEPLRDRIFPHWKGSQWVRLLPSIDGSASESFLVKVPLLTRGNITVVDPGFFGKRSLFREAHQTMKHSTDPYVVSRRYNKEKNANGVRCWPVDHYVGWVLSIDPVATRFEVLVVNANDGTIGGPAQLGHKILTQATQINNDPSLPADERGKLLYEDVASITKGNHLNIQKNGEARSTTYEAKFSTTQTNITSDIERLGQEEISKLQALELVLHCPDENEQAEILKALLGEQFFLMLFPEFAPDMQNTVTVNEAPTQEAAPAAEIPATVVETPAPTENAAPVESTPAPAAAAAATQAPAAEPAPAATATGESPVNQILQALADFRNESTPEATKNLKGLLDANPDLRQFVEGTLSVTEKAALDA